MRFRECAQVADRAAYDHHSFTEKLSLLPRTLLLSTHGLPEPTAEVRKPALGVVLSPD